MSKQSYRTEYGVIVALQASQYVSHLVVYTLEDSKSGIYIGKSHPVKEKGVFLRVKAPNVPVTNDTVNLCCYHAGGKDYVTSGREWVRVCSKCGTCQPITGFNHSSTGAKGFRSYCRECQKPYNATTNANRKKRKEENHMGRNVSAQDNFQLSLAGWKI